MLQITKVLYPTDFSSCAAHALPYAVQLAGQHQAELHMLHAVVLHEGDPADAAYQLPNIEELYTALEQQAEAQMRATVQAYSGAAPVIKQAHIRSLSPASAILEYAASEEIDLIVMGTHGRRGLKRLLLGSVTEEVVRLTPCPALTVPERGGERGADQVQRILVPVDFSEHASLALRYAANLAALYGAELHLTHIVDEIAYPDFYPPIMPGGASMTEELREQATRRLDALLADLPEPRAEARTHIRSGRAAPAIAELADELAADLIVIASHGLTGIRHAILGSVTEQVVRRASSPVLVVKAFGKRLL